MGKYDDLFAETTPEDSVFADKGALDPFADPEEIVTREEQERALARMVNGVHEGYLPPTVSIHGPPGTGKTAITRRLCREFAARTDDVAVEYVNLKECRTLFSAANEILLEVGGEKVGAYEGLDGAFTAIWEALEGYPEWTILILDEIDQVTQDSNYDPNEIFYRLRRGEGKLERGLSLWLLSNQLLEVDLRLDSRVQSAMSDESVFFPPYRYGELESILSPRVAAAFREGVLPEEVFGYGVREAANRWGDVRKALALFRHAGEEANERGLETISTECLDRSMTDTEKEATLRKLTSLPRNHLLVLAGIVGWENPRTGEITQPVTTAKITESVEGFLDEDERFGPRAIRNLITDLETMGLVEAWVDRKESGVKRRERRRSSHAGFAR